ncbi:hypothetical protein M569_13945, partial [Genlisea aurea]
MLKRMVACCKVYISESRNAAALEIIESGAKLHPEVAIVNKFEDAIYNRVGYTLVSGEGTTPRFSSLRNSVFEMVKAAFAAIDLEKHCGSHPRLGVVDHICFHPLAGISLDQVSEIARVLAADLGSKLQVATFLYGAAHHEGRTLASLRRELGYFRPSSSDHHWSGSLNSDILPVTPDEGPPRATPRKGVVVVGAAQWVSNYNVPVLSTDVDAVRRIAKRVSQRGGGLPSVQSMALAHGKGITEVACNLLDAGRVGGDRVQREVERLAAEEGGLVVGEGYYTDHLPDELLKRYF